MDRRLTGELFRCIANNDSSKDDFDNLLAQFPKDASLVDGFGFPAVNSAAMHGNDKAITALLDHGVDPHTCDPNSHTPLMIALRGHGEGFHRSAKVIIDASLKTSASVQDWIHLTDNQQMTVTHFAARSGDAAAIERFASLGADINRKDAKERTPLHYAAVRARFRAVQRLVALGAEVDGIDRDGNTPALTCALELPHVQAAAYRRRLSSVGDTSSPIALGLSNDDKREEEWRRAVLETLLVAGTSRTTSNKDGQTLNKLGESQRWLRLALASECEDSPSQEGENSVANGLSLRSNSLNVPVPQIRSRKRKNNGHASSGSSNGKPRITARSPALDGDSLDDEAFEEVAVTKDPTPEDSQEPDDPKKSKITWAEMKRLFITILLFVVARYISFHAVGWYHSWYSGDE